MSEKKVDIHKALLKVQDEISVPKNQVNSFGGYNYRNAEDILAAATPLLAKHGITMTVRDDIEAFEGRVYVKAMVYLNDQLFGQAYARECQTKKGMDEAQITGAASSYARKYALNGVFLLDDVKDADSMDNREKKPAKASKADWI